MPQSLTASHLNTRNDHYRGTYWYGALNETDGIANATPVIKESLRNQKGRLVARTTRSDLPVRTLHDYEGVSSLPVGAFKKSIGTLSETSGTVRSLPTNLSDKPTAVNINHLRSQRTELIWKDFFNGSRTFKPGSNLDNWIEERHDGAYTSNSIPERQPDTYQSVATKTLKAAQELYSTRTNPSANKKGPAVVRINSAEDDYRNYGYQRLNKRRPDYLNYASKRNDVAATDSNMSGCYWVGTAPTNDFKSIGRSVYSDHSKLEFQKRSKASDTKSRVLCGVKEGHKPAPKELETYRAKWFMKEGGTPWSDRSWRTEYGSVF